MDLFLLLKYYPLKKTRCMHCNSRARVYIFVEKNKIWKKEFV